MNLDNHESHYRFANILESLLLWEVQEHTNIISEEKLNKLTTT